MTVRLAAPTVCMCLACGASHGQSQPATKTVLAAKIASGYNLIGLGGKCNGSADDSVALANGANFVYVPVGDVCYTASYDFGTLPSPTVGGIGAGQIKGSSGNLMAPLTTTLSSAPAQGNWNSLATAWGGDLQSVGLAHLHIVEGGATLGQPASAYSQPIEGSGEISALYNSSGYNGASGGRTGVAQRYMISVNVGQGDVENMFCDGVVSSQYVGSGTANINNIPNVTCMAGGLYGGASGESLEFLGDLVMADNGYDNKAITLLGRNYRSNINEALQESWEFLYDDNSGTYPLDQTLRVIGLHVEGLDFSTATMPYFRLGDGWGVLSGGSGYTNGGTITVTGGTSLTPTKFLIGSCGGTITNGCIALLNGGIYTAAPNSSYTTITVTGGGGTGASFTGEYISAPFMLLPYTGGCTEVGVGGSEVSTQGNLYSEICSYNNGVTIGGPNNTLSYGNIGDDLAVGNFHNSTGVENMLVGLYADDEGQNRSFTFSSGNFNDGHTGHSQTRSIIFRASSGANASPVRATSDTYVAGTSNSYIFPISSTNNIRWTATAIDETSGDKANWYKIKTGVVTRGGSGNAAAYIGDGSSALTPDASTGSAGTATITISTDTTNQALNVTFTPPSGNTHIYNTQIVLWFDQQVL